MSSNGLELRLTKVTFAVPLLRSSRICTLNLNIHVLEIEVSEVNSLVAGPLQGGPFGPYVQSQRLSIYQDHIQSLVEVSSNLHEDRVCV